MSDALIGSLGTIVAAFVGVLTWYLASSSDRRRDREERENRLRAEEAQRDQRVLDIVVALHSEILAGIVANRRQLTVEDVSYALKQTNPFTTADETDFVFESVRGDISILPAEVIHSVVQYYRVAMQSNLVTKDLRDPYFLQQPVNERRRIIGFLLQLVELQKILGEEALSDLAAFASRSGIDLAKNEERASRLFERASTEIASVFMKSDKSGQKPSRLRLLTTNHRSIGRRARKVK
jgi:hypothetical protein